jgi:hypothetical protein
MAETSSSCASAAGRVRPAQKLITGSSFEGRIAKLMPALIVEVGLDTWKSAAPFLI